MKIIRRFCLCIILAAVCAVPFTMLASADESAASIFSIVNNVTEWQADGSSVNVVTVYGTGDAITFNVGTEVEMIQVLPAAGTGFDVSVNGQTYKMRNDTSLYTYSGALTGQEAALSGQENALFVGNTGKLILDNEINLAYAVEGGNAVNHWSITNSTITTFWTKGSGVPAGLKNQPAAKIEVLSRETAYAQFGEMLAAKGIEAQEALSASMRKVAVNTGVNQKTAIEITETEGSGGLDGSGEEEDPPEE